MNNMHLLITNDDGIHAEGIQTLVRVIMENYANWRLSVIAPDRERSAVGHAITMHKPLRVEEIPFSFNEKLKGYAVNGTPSDCVKLAVEAILEEKPDLVISGINRGSNLGTDVLYSGTVSAAVEGTILGIPSIAMSLTGSGSRDDFIYAALFAAALIPALVAGKLDKATLININVPVDTASIRGVRVTSLGNRRYCNAFEKRTDPRGMIYYWMAGEAVDDDCDLTESDTKAIRDSYISVTPLHLQLTNRAAMPKLQEIIDNMDS